MGRGQEVEIRTPEDRPFPWRPQDNGHITGTPTPEPPKDDGISIWPR